MEYANLMTRHCICTYLDLACQKLHFIGPEVDWSLGAVVTRLTTSVYVTVDRFRSSFAYNCPKCQFTRVPRCYSGHFNHYSLFVDSLHCPYSVQVLFLSWRLNPTEHPWTLEGPRGDLQQEGVVVSPEKKHASCKCPIFRDSLTGVLRESPRPNILEKIQDRLDSVDGIKPLWRLAPGQVVSKLAKFTSDTETQSVTDIKGRVDRDLQGYYYHHQSSYICYILVPPRVTLLLMMVDRSYPRLQPIFGFELAISAISWCR